MNYGQPMYSNGYNQQPMYSNGYQKPLPLPQSTSPTAAGGMNGSYFQQPPMSIYQPVNQQQQYNPQQYNQQQQYQYNQQQYNPYMQQQQQQQTNNNIDQKGNDSDSPPPPPNKPPPPKKDKHKRKKHHHKHKKKRKHTDKTANKTLPTAPGPKNKMLPNNMNNMNNMPNYNMPNNMQPTNYNMPNNMPNNMSNNMPNNRVNKPLPNKPYIAPITQANVIKAPKRHKRRKRKHTHKKKRKDSDSPPPPPPPSDHQGQFTRRRGISEQKFKPKQISINKSHLKLMNGKILTFKTKETITYLKNVLLKEVLFKSMKSKFDDIIAVMYQINCSTNDCVIKQNEYSGAYFIIQYGAFDIILQKKNKNKKIGEIKAGKSFGENSLLYSTPSAATLKATQKSVVWALDALKFKQIRSKKVAIPSKPLPQKTKIIKSPIPAKKIPEKKYKNLINCKLNDFTYIGVLGVGSFGRVSLVKSKNTQITYSLKKIAKDKIIETGQQEHIKNERATLAVLSSDFCVKLYGVYQDKFNIYFCMEPILGGELFAILRWNKKFSEKTARFYTACVILAFEHLHNCSIIYRDLKPENLLISSKGYCKLVDFGFAKKLNNSCTLCGTPDYLSPEIIQNDQQTVGVDWWTLGILIYEMVIGHTPFQDDENGKVKMYEKILTYDVEFGDVKLSPRCGHLIDSLLEKNPFQRLGSTNNKNGGGNGTNAILGHPWFHGFDWNKMRKQQITSPYIPEINGNDDLTHFDEYDDENIQQKSGYKVDEYQWCQDF